MTVKTQTSVGARDRWRFRIEDPEGGLLALSPVWGYDSQKEAADTAAKAIQAPRVASLEAALGKATRALDTAGTLIKESERDETDLRRALVQANRRERWMMAALFFLVLGLAFTLFPGVSGLVLPAA